MHHSTIMNVWSVYLCSLLYSYANVCYTSQFALSVIQHRIRSLSVLSKLAIQR